jgi:ATP-dependent Clp protease ATP-binding subunit ClpA
VIVFSLDVPLAQWEAIPDWDSTGGRLEAVRRQLRSSFARQLDRIVPFSPLSPATQREILRQQVRELRTELGSYRVGIQLRQSAVDLICSRGYSAENGAVELVPYFRSSVADPIRKLVANRRRDSMVMVHVKARDGEIVFQSSRGRDSGASTALTDERVTRRRGTKKSRRETGEIG